MSSRDDAFRRMERALGAQGFRHDASACAAYALGGVVPETLALPDTPEKAAELLAYAAEGGLSVVPWGSASGADPGTAAATAPPERYDVALSSARLDAILDHDSDNLTITTQGGASLFDVAHRLRPERQVLALGWPGSHHTLGGWVAANRAVPKRLAYGAARDQLLGVRLALSGNPGTGAAEHPGQLVRFGGKVLKNVAGYDISKLVIGSLGTAGVIVETTWKLFALPDDEGYWGGAFPTVAHALRFAGALTQSKLLPACVFLLDAAAATHFAAVEGLPWEPGAALAWVGFDGRSAALRRQTADATELAAREQGTTLIPRDELGDAAAAYLMGEDAPGTAGANTAGAGSGGGGTLRLRVGAPPSALGAVHAALAQGLATVLSGADVPPPQSVLDYPAGRISLRASLPEGRMDALTAWIRSARMSLAPHRGFLIIERGPAEVRRALGTRGGLGGAERLVRAVQGQLDPRRVLTPERLLD